MINSILSKIDREEKKCVRLIFDHLYQVNFIFFAKNLNPHAVGILIDTTLINNVSSSKFY